MIVAGKNELVLKGLNCAACAAKMEEKNKVLNGVTDVSLNFSTKKLTLETNRVAELDQVLQEVKAIINKLEPDVVVTKKD